MYGGRSPKTLNGPGPNGTAQVKGKKREHSSDSCQLRPEDMLEAAIAKITDDGRLVDFEGVEKIIQLMQPESGDKKVDLASRIMLVNVISVTDSFDCLSRFVQLRGLHILDEWLQEFHKGKIGDGSSKEGDLSVEEFLFALLRALDKLPVNIHALQTCNVGKSVNHLRSHKNPEILKKARTLVDMWKKSVEAEMNMIERKRVEQMNVIETRSGTRRAVKVQRKHSSGEAIAKLPESPSPTNFPAGISPSGVAVKQEKSSSCSPSASTKGSPISATPDACFPEKRLIVRLPNTVRSPARTASASGGSLDVRASGKGDNNVAAMDTDSCKGKDGSDDDGEASKGAADSASGGTIKSGKSYEAAYSSINALVESCAKFSEVNTSVGMDLLARVAAGEISRSDVSPSPLPLPEDTCSKDNGNPRQSIEDGCQSEENLKVSNDHARLAENSIAEVGPAPFAASSDAGTSGKVETHVNDESCSWSSTDKHEDEKKEHDDEDSELLTSSCGQVSLGKTANMDPNSCVLLQTSENEGQEGDVWAPPVSETTVKLDFDLNEIVCIDETESERNWSLHSSSCLVAGKRPVSVTIAAAAKGPFLSSEKLLKSKRDQQVGWKGSAATSAFRPAEPRKAREFLDFDLNVGVVDENNPPSKYLDSRGLDLDLNACEESPDVTVIPNIPPRSLLSGGFDLNNGPGIIEETGSESVPHSRNGIQFLPSVRIGNFHSWFPPTSTYPAHTYSMPQRMSTPMAAVGTGTGAPFSPEIFRRPVLSSSPAVAFPSTTPFQFPAPGFPFETNFSIPSNTTYVGSSGGPGPVCFPTIPSQLVAPPSSAYRPYVMSLPGGSSDNKK